MGSKFLATLALLPFVRAADLFFDVPITNVTVAPDGFPRQAIQAGTFPGSHILANKGDTLHINVSMLQENPDMRQSTVIHWHGLFQMRTASEDGPAFVNQCPIALNQFYQYIIPHMTSPLNNQTGTFWFHSHLSTQYVDGERGVVVVYDPEDPLGHLYDVDDDSTIITLADWYHSPAAGLMDQFRVDGITPVPSSGLLNGRYVGGPLVDYAVINVEQGKRFRVINQSAYAAFDFSIDDHIFDVIETDGIETVPLAVTGMHHPNQPAAQRYSIVLNATQPINNYWIRAPIVVAQQSANHEQVFSDTSEPPMRSPLPLPPSSTRFPRLKVAVEEEGETAVEEGVEKVVEEEVETASPSSSRSLFDPGAPNGANPPDRRLNLTFNSPGNGVWQINGEVYVPPILPTLLKVINGATFADDFNTSEHTFVLQPNEVIELEIHGSDHGIIHPFHLHGHAFDVVKSSSGPENFVNPPRRDVIGVQQSGVIIQFRADNPGPWFLHCHIDWHLEAGLAVVFAEDPEQQRTGDQSQIVKQTWLDLCPDYYAQPLDEQRK
ncbi:Laccase 16 [Mycena sanguinolenta]|uniref:Laccase 16 n=1 Tax=Mycena sanguinolenta TaxID=230812 RepID=A0A8H6XU07_9AGAR|nr:Laccase 16 [Mycena sanguinolenta]